MAAKTTTPQNLGDKLLDGWTTHTVNVLRVAAGQKKETLAMLEKLELTLAGQVQASTGTLLNQQKLAALLKQTQDSIAATYQSLAEHNTKSLEKAAQLEATKAVNVLNTTIGVKLTTVGQTPAQLAAIASNVMVDGKFLKEHWAKQSADLRDKFATTIREGMLKGESVDQLVRRVRGSAANGYADGIMVASKAQAATLVRTSVLTTANTARIETLKANPQVNKGIQWVSTLDTRTSLICKALDGKQWSFPDLKPVGHAVEFPGPIAHWNCRSTQIAVVHSWDALAGPNAKPKLKDFDTGQKGTLDELLQEKLIKSGMTPQEAAGIKASTRASMDGQVASSLTYEEWLKGKDQGFQDQVLGPARAQMWRDGKLTLSEMIDQDAHPLTLAELHDLIAKNQALPPAKEGEGGLSIAERKLLEQAMVQGIQANQHLVTFMSEAGETTTSIGESIPTQFLDQVKGWKEVTVLSNTLNPGAVWSPQQLKAFAQIPGFKKAILVGPTGRTLTLRRKGEQMFTSADAEEIVTAFQALKNNAAIPQTYKKLAKAVNQNGVLKLETSATGNVHPPAKTYNETFPDLVQKPAPFFDAAAVAQAKEKAQADEAAAAAIAAHEAQVAKAKADLRAAAAKKKAEDDAAAAAALKAKQEAEAKAAADAAAAKKLADEAAAALKAAQEAEDKLHMEAQTKIGEILANPKGQVLKAEVIGKLMKSQPDLKPADLLDLAHQQTVAIQEKKGMQKVLGLAKKKLLAGQVPTAAQKKVIDTMTPEAKKAWVDAIAAEKAKLQTAAHQAALLQAQQDAAAAAHHATVQAAVPAPIPTAPAPDQVHKIKALNQPEAYALANTFQNDLEDKGTPFANFTTEQKQTWLALKIGSTHHFVATDAAGNIIGAIGLLEGMEDKEHNLLINYVGGKNEEVKKKLLHQAAGMAETKGKGLELIPVVGQEDFYIGLGMKDEGGQLYAVDAADVGKFKTAVGTPGPAPTPAFQAVQQPAGPLASKLEPGKATTAAKLAAKYQDQLPANPDEWTTQQAKILILLEKPAPDGYKFTVTDPGQEDMYVGAAIAKSSPQAVQVTQWEATEPESLAKLFHGAAEAAVADEKGLSILASTEAQGQKLKDMGFEKLINSPDPKGNYYVATDDVPAMVDKLQILATGGTPAAPAPIPIPAPAPAPAPPPKPAPLPGPKPVPKGAAKAPPIEFPADPAKLTVVKGLGGSTGAELVKDEKGNLFVRKKGATGDHVTEEQLADEIYSGLGANVPRGKLYNTPKGPVKLAQYIEGETLATYLAKATPAQKTALKQKIQEHFAADALMGNWDVLGTGKDNVLVDKNGDVWRIDNGGSLRFRAQGQPKLPAQWTEFATELWTMRGIYSTPTLQGLQKDIAAGFQKDFKEFYGGVTIYDIARQAEAFDPAAFAHAPPEVRDVLEKRMGHLKALAETALDFEHGEWKAEAADLVVLSAMELRQKGVVARMSPELTHTAGTVTVKDENGKDFDELRSKSSSSVQATSPQDPFAQTFLQAIISVNASHKKGLPQFANPTKVAAVLGLEAQIDKWAKSTKPAEKAVAAHYKPILEKIKEAQKNHAAGKVAVQTGDLLPNFDVSKGAQLYTSKANPAAAQPMRPAGSITQDVSAYISSIGGDAKAVAAWMGGQAGSSWSSNARAMKYFIATSSGKDPKSYYWHQGGIAAAKNAFDALAATVGGEENLRKTFSAWIAYTQEILSNTTLPNVDRKRRVVLLVRTEEDAVLKKEGVTLGKYGGTHTIMRASNESHGAMALSGILGHEATVQAVPFANITGLYLTERPGSNGAAGSGGSGFLGDSENEYTADTNRIPFVYAGKISGGGTMKSLSAGTAEWKNKLKPGFNLGQDASTWGVPLTHIRKPQG